MHVCCCFGGSWEGGEDIRNQHSIPQPDLGEEKAQEREPEAMARKERGNCAKPTLPLRFLGRKEVVVREARMERRSSAGMGSSSVV